MGTGPNLTIITIAMAAFITAFVLIMTMTNQFYTDNNLVIDSDYNSTYTTIVDNATTKLDEYSTKLYENDGNLLTSALSGIGATINAFAIGMGAITTLITLPVILIETINLLSSIIGPVGTALIWFVTFVISFYIAMKLVKALRGTNDEA